MKIKRIIAYLLDLLIVSMIASLIFKLPIFKDEYNKFTEVYDSYYEMLKNIGSADEDAETLNKKAYETSKDTATLTIIELGTTIVYFCIFQYIFNGQTLGKKVLKIKIVSEDDTALKPNLFILREVLLCNIIFRLIDIFTLIGCSESLYFSINKVTSCCSMIVTFSIIGVMIFRNDERGLHDLIAKTKVIETQKIEK